MAVVPIRTFASLRTFSRFAAVLVWGAPSLVCAQAYTGAPTPQAPATHISIDLNAMPAPYATPTASNGPQTISAPSAQLAVPLGFTANVFAQGLSHARNLAVGPTGDVFLAESGADRITLLRDADGDGRAETRTTFAAGYNNPYGMAVTQNYLYVADLDGVTRVRYNAGETAAIPNSREAVTPANALGDASGHSTRNIALSPDGTRLYAAIGSRGNIAEEPVPRATIQEFTLGPFSAMATAQRTLASGLRNPVGLAVQPGTAELYTVVNERDGMGDELVPDFLTRVTDGGFYGWPYSYMGDRPQPNLTPSNPAAAAQLVARAIVPDVAFQSHSAPLGAAFSTGTKFPAQYRGGVFVALHGSWNAARPRGYMVAYVPFTNGRPAGGYSIFASGFWVTGTNRAQVRGRPASVAVAADGALLIADDGSQTVWRVTYTGSGTSVMSVHGRASAQTLGRSYLRIANTSATAGQPVLVVRDGQTGALIGEWTPPTVPPHASLQIDMAAVEAAITGTARATLTVGVRSPFGGFLQHAVWNPTVGTLENMTQCDSGPSADQRTLINVHSSAIAGYPARIRVYNAGSVDQPATLTIRNADTGGVLATWQSSAIPAGAALDISVPALEAGASPRLSSPPYHYVVSLADGFSGALQQVVGNPTGQITDITDKCTLVAQ
jgi:glucose/arabinose dehydrogenase